ncbi:hypothetical protein Syun_025440 [Stephania yunnanensis]|uniref:Uncharacterized protein n=1 Tax=Stephania yunnanensis TaxID=152371 RepID=A0AAP0ERN4_9MAGN
MTGGALRWHRCGRSGVSKSVGTHESNLIAFSPDEAYMAPKLVGDRWCVLCLEVTEKPSSSQRSPALQTSALPGNKGRHMHMFHANKLGEDHNKLHRMNRSDLIQLTEESLNLGIAYGEDTLAAVRKLMKFKKHYCNQCFETCLETHGMAIDSFRQALGALKGNSYDEVNGCEAGAWACVDSCEDVFR